MISHSKANDESQSHKTDSRRRSWYKNFLQILLFYLWFQTFSWFIKTSLFFTYDMFSILTNHPSLAITSHKTNSKNIKQKKHQQLWMYLLVLTSVILFITSQLVTSLRIRHELEVKVYIVSYNILVKIYLERITSIKPKSNPAPKTKMSIRKIIIIYVIYDLSVQHK